jgi:hypothetical protein
LVVIKSTADSNKIPTDIQTLMYVDVTSSRRAVSSRLEHVPAKCALFADKDVRRIRILEHIPVKPDRDVL